MELTTDRLVIAAFLCLAALVVAFILCITGIGDNVREARMERSGDPADPWKDVVLTKRDIFAALAMQGFCANAAWVAEAALAYPNPKDGALITAETSIAFADALIAELAKGAE